MKATDYVVDVEPTSEQLDRQIARVSDGWCRWCPQRLQIVTTYEQLYGACSCCGFQFQVKTQDWYEGSEPAVDLTTTGWPAGMGGAENVGQCEHVDGFEALLRG